MSQIRKEAKRRAEEPDVMAARVMEFVAEDYLFAAVLDR